MRKSDENEQEEVFEMKSLQQVLNRAKILYKIIKSSKKNYYKL